VIPESMRCAWDKDFGNAVATILIPTRPSLVNDTLQAKYYLAQIESLDCSPHFQYELAGLFYIR